MNEMKERLFKQLYDENRTIEGVIKEIGNLKTEKELLLNKPKAKHHKKVIKDINNKICKLNILKQKLPTLNPVETPRDRWGIPIKQKKQAVEFQEESYVYKGKSKPKTGSGTARVPHRKKSKNKAW